MGFENLSRRGIVEVAAKIALKYNVTYNVKQNVFSGTEENVAKAVTALERWARAERVWSRE